MKDRTPATKNARGRRTGNPDTRGAILAAAHARFLASGYDATTMRAVARDAGVDAALVHYFFGTKKDLFAAALALPVSPAGALEEIVTAGGTEDLGERILRRLLPIWDAAGSDSPLVGLVGSAFGRDEAATLVHEYIRREILGRLAAALDAPDAERRAALTGTQLIGLIVARYVLRVEPLASASHDEIVAAVAPTLQRYLTGTVAP
jgi:AcrR family transcriptional regulator